MDKRVIEFVDKIKKETKISVLYTRDELINQCKSLEKEFTELKDKCTRYYNKLSPEHQKIVSDYKMGTGYTKLINAHMSKDDVNDYVSSDYKLQECIDKSHKLDKIFKFCSNEMTKIYTIKYDASDTEKKIIEKINHDYGCQMQIITSKYFGEEGVVEELLIGNTKFDQLLLKIHSSVQLEQPHTKYKSPYMQILEWLVKEFEITEKSQDTFVKKNFVNRLNENKDFFEKTFKVSLSDKQIDMLATFVRRPQKGGLK